MAWPLSEIPVPSDTNFIAVASETEDLEFYLVLADGTKVHTT